MRLLQAPGEQTVELYGVWDGDFAMPPALREEIQAAAILDPLLRFEERGFYIARRD